MKIERLALALPVLGLWIAACNTAPSKRERTIVMEFEPNRLRAVERELYVERKNAAFRAWREGVCVLPAYVPEGPVLTLPEGAPVVMRNHPPLNLPRLDARDLETMSRIPEREALRVDVIQGDWASMDRAISWLEARGGRRTDP